MKDEIWIPLKDFEECYEISNYGNIRTIPRRLKVNNNGYIDIKQTYKYQKEHYKGYLQVSLKKNGKKYTKYVHRLVAENFIPNPNNLQQVNHKDENKKNNKVDNLEWCTSDYNLSYGTRIERINKSKEKYLGVSTHNSKKVMYNNIIYDSISKAAKANSISEYYIIKNCNDKNNKNCKFI